MLQNDQSPGTPLTDFLPASSKFRITKALSIHNSLTNRIFQKSKWNRNSELRADMSDCTPCLRSLMDGRAETFTRDLTHAKEECVNRLSLLGLLNPYKIYPRWNIPPTHININYLLRPYALIERLVMDSMYDSHVDGKVYENRADLIDLSNIRKANPENMKLLPTPQTPLKSTWRSLSDASMLRRFVGGSATKIRK